MRDSQPAPNTPQKGCQQPSDTLVEEGVVWVCRMVVRFGAIAAMIFFAGLPVLRGVGALVGGVCIGLLVALPFMLFLAHLTCAPLPLYRTAHTLYHGPTRTFETRDLSRVIIHYSPCLVHWLTPTTRAPPPPVVVVAKVEEAGAPPRRSVVETARRKARRDWRSGARGHRGWGSGGARHPASLPRPGGAVSSSTPA